MRLARSTSWLPLAAAATTVLVVDLTTKVLAVHDPSLFGDGYIHNPDLPSAASRVAACLATMVYAAVLTRVFATRGVGPVPLVWVATGLLVGGVLGNWSSGAIWPQGVPDFIDHRGRMWNLADFTIGFGMLLLLTSSLGYPIRAFVRGLPHRADASSSGSCASSGSQSPGS